MKAITAALMLAWLPVQAAVIAETISGSVRVELHDQMGHCQGGAMLALWLEGDAKFIGCWRVTSTVVQIAWSDADVTRISVAAFRQVKGI